MLAIAVKEGDDSNGGGKEGVTEGDVDERTVEGGIIDCTIQCNNFISAFISFWFFSITVIRSSRCFISK